MGKLSIYATTKDELDKKIADEARKLYLEGVDYEIALRQAKEMFLNYKGNKKATKDTGK